MTTLILLGVLFAVMVLSAIMWGALLQLGMRWAKVPGGTLIRSSLLYFIVAIPSFVLVGLLQYFLSDPNAALVAAAGGFGVAFFVQTSLIAWFYKARFADAVKAWLPTLLSAVLAYPLAAFVVRPFLFDTYVIPSNGMAPTLIGEHVVGRCPGCGAPMYGSVPHGVVGIIERGKSVRMICTNFHSHRSPQYTAGTGSLDRILAMKFLTPKRWDLAVFRNPENERQTYVQRVIGLPGETVVIRDGAVFINGTKLDPPADLQGIRYVTKIPDEPDLNGAYWGTDEHPAVLGSDEYFMLGDNTTASHDSRFWKHGIEGHPPYAVPKSHLMGTATHIYWPFERTRTLR